MDSKVVRFLLAAPPGFYLTLMALLMLAASLGMAVERSWFFAWLFALNALGMREAANRETRHQQ